MTCIIPYLAAGHFTPGRAFAIIRDMKRLSVIMVSALMLATSASAGNINLLELIGSGARNSARSRQQSAKRRQPIRVESEPAATNAAPVAATAAAKQETAEKQEAKKPVAEAKPLAETRPVTEKPAIETKTVAETKPATEKPVAKAKPVAETKPATEKPAAEIKPTIRQQAVKKPAVPAPAEAKIAELAEVKIAKPAEVVKPEKPVQKPVAATLTSIANETTAAVVPPGVQAATNAAATTTARKEGAPAHISSDKVYYDRKEGYAVFTGRVHVDSADYQLHAKKAYVFFEGTNELKRIVATGSVAITNDTKRAYGAKASYYRNTGMVVLYGGNNAPAEVRDESKGEDQIVRGSKIKFWTTSEQVEVVDANITSPASGGLGRLKDGIMSK